MQIAVLTFDGFNELDSFIVPFMASDPLADASTGGTTRERVSAV
ncbi:hypothetical protein [Sphingopyxis sp. 113P3]|nr:hypothetical protein [Sphingopyxis sp. 113P3]